MGSKRPLVNKYLINIHVFRCTKFYWPLLFAVYPSGELIFHRVIYWTHQLNRAAKLKLGLRLMNELFARLCPGNRKKKSLHMRCALRSATINAMSLKNTRNIRNNYRNSYKAQTSFQNRRAVATDTSAKPMTTPTRPVRTLSPKDGFGS